MCKCKEECNEKVTLEDVRDRLLEELMNYVDTHSIDMEDARGISETLKILSEVKTESFTDSFLKLQQLNPLGTPHACAKETEHE